MHHLRRPNVWGPPVLLAAVLLYYLGYVKDDAWISFRYAAHWARGDGLVFNPGEHVEGFTNFGWTALAAAFLRLHVPPLVTGKVLGALAAFAGLFGVRRLGGDRAAWLWAASPTVGLWAASAMEPVAIAALAVLAWLSLERGRWLPAGLLLAACAILRPEGHLLVLAFALVRWRTLPVAAAVLLPYHLLRWQLFGSLVPLPFYVKASSPQIGAGLAYAGLFLLFYGHALLLYFALRSRKWVAAATCVIFVAYLVYVGGDEMRWFRLYAPALGLLFALAGHKLPARLVPLWVAFGLIAHATAWPLRDYLSQDQRGYFALADEIRARARPGDTALFQDAGATPYRALDVPFSDPIGVTDPRVAHMYADAHFSPFRGAGPPALEKRLRDELLGRKPRFIALVAYVDANLRRDVRERVPVDPEGTLRPFLRANSYSHGIPDDERFVRGYRFVRAFRRNDGYWLALYEKALIPSTSP